MKISVQNLAQLSLSRLQQSHTLAVEIMLGLFEDHKSRFLLFFESEEFDVFEKLLVKSLCLIKTPNIVEFVVKCLNH